MKLAELEHAHHELDKTVAEALVVQAGNSTQIALNEKCINDMKEKHTAMIINDKKTTALYSAIGSGIMVAATLIIKWILTGG